MKSHLLLALTLCSLLSSCKQFAKVRETRPTLHPVSSTLGVVNTIHQGLVDSLKQTKRDPLAALAGYLTAAETASKQLALTPKDAVIREDYNFAVARILTIIEDAKLDPWSKPLTIPSKDGDFTLTRRPDKRKGWNPALYIFKPADQFDISGAFINEHNTKDGLGAPSVAISKEDNKDALKDFALPSTYHGVTALAFFNGRTCELGFEDPLETESVKFKGHTFPLAADFTVPIAVRLANSNAEKMGLARLINPEKYAATARILRLQPYDPNKTVILVVHGLNSSPATWTPMINTLRSSEEIRRNFQFWVFSYPSGYPYMHSAAILRNQLDAIQERFPLKKKMVVLGHSMGGCISRLLITDVGDKIWLDYFDKPPADVPMSASTRQLLSEALIFNQRPEVGRVVFIAAPLRGADKAGGKLGELGAKFVKAPFALIQAGNEIIEQVTDTAEEANAKTLKRMPNSVDTLSPNNRFVQTINTFPLSTTVPYHAIVGDRGKGGNKDKTKPVSSDGLVPYWSSYLPKAQSELIVPSGHGAHQHPQAIEEVKRILIQHSRQNH